jgi:CTP:molybdopterin cytidylyltransferase MocA
MYEQTHKIMLMRLRGAPPGWQAAVGWRIVANNRVAGVLLAAGEGKRLGRPKALVELGGRRLVDRGADLLREGGTAPVLVVTGAVPVTVPGVAVVPNPDWRTGMGSSLAAGLRALPGDCAAAVIALVDQPLIGPEVVRRLLAAHQAGASLAVATYHGQPRNPVLLARGHWAGVLAAADGDTGARPYLRAHPDLVALVECADIGRPDDVDTPEDLARVGALLAGPAGSPG